MVWSRRILVICLVTLFAFSIAPPGIEANDTGPNWADPANATIRPGSTINNPSGSCTSNFVFTQGADVFLGLAAHCFTLEGSTATNGCTTNSRGLGTSVNIQGATRPGTLVYSSWIAMQQAGETGDACDFNDFALVKIHPNDIPRVSPAVRHFGGPAGMVESAPIATKVITFGATPMRPGIDVGGIAHTGAREGYTVITMGGGWSHIIYTNTPGLPGDSGSAVMTGNGDALGVLVTLVLAPTPGANGVTNLARALDYAEAKTGVTYELATGPITTTGFLP
jgi:hypothetical protein